MANAFELKGSIQASNIANVATDFRIDPNPFLFRALSANLYRDRIGAVIREYRNNAWDAHVETGQARPVEITLPDRSQLPAPYFEVKDFGGGMSPQQIEELFVTYGASDKRDADALNQIGGFGFGSKSAFAYSDQFTVKSRYGGVEHVYLCKIENHLPKVQLINSSPTSEPGGLTINVGVRREDIDAFVERYERIREWCDREDKLNIAVTIEKPAITDQGNGWAIVSGGRSGKYDTNRRVRVLLGNVLYDLDWASIPNMEEAQNMFRHVSLVLKFGAKDLTPAPSREDLSYDRELTVPAIRERLSKCMEEVMKSAKDSIDSASSYWESNVRYEELRQANELVNRHTFYYKGKKIVGGRTYVRNLPDDRNKRHETIGDPLMVSYFRRPKTITRRYNDGFQRTDFPYSKDTKLFYCETPDSTFFQRWIVGFDEVDGFLPGVKGENVRLFVGPFWKFMYALRDLGNPPWQYAEDVLPTKEVYKTIKNSGAIATRQKATPYVLTGANIDEWGYTTNFRKKEVDMDDGGLYLKSDKFNIEQAGLVKALFETDILSYKDVVVCSKMWHEKFDNHPKWTNAIEPKRLKAPILKWLSDNVSAFYKGPTIRIDKSHTASYILSRLGVSSVSVPDHGYYSYDHHNNARVLGHFAKTNYGWVEPDHSAIALEAEKYIKKYDAIKEIPMVSNVRYISNVPKADADAFCDFVIKHYNLKP